MPNTWPHTPHTLGAINVAIDDDILDFKYRWQRGSIWSVGVLRKMSLSGPSLNGLVCNIDTYNNLSLWYDICTCGLERKLGECECIRHLNWPLTEPKFDGI